ncbi:MAG: DinB family protein [Gemmatimonadota bacterium]
MRKVIALLVLAATPALAQQPTAQAATPAMPSPSNGGVTAAKAVWMIPHGYVVRALEQTPDSLLSFKPTPAVRSLGELFAHVADGEHLFCSLALGEPMMDAGVEKSKKTKAEFMQALKESAAHCDKAYAQTDAQAMTPASFMGQQSNRMFLLGMNGAHDYEHYGNMVTYLRLKGITPPSSQM